MSKPRITIRMPADLYAYIQSKGDNSAKTIRDIIATHKRIEDRVKAETRDEINGALRDFNEATNGNALPNVMHMGKPSIWQRIIRFVGGK